MFSTSFDLPRLDRGDRSRHWLGLGFAGLVLVAGVAGLTLSRSRSSLEPVRLNLHQQWQLQPGTQVGNIRVTSGLGDLVLALEGQALYMPKAGRVEPLVSEASADSTACVVVSSPEIPAYKLRLCHLQQLQLGELPQGAVIGRGEQVAIAMLRKQPEGTWAFVEPAPSLLEVLLNQP